MKELKQELKPSFFARDTVQVAQELLGKIICVNGQLCRIVETEAYGSDPASHAFHKTERSALMYDTYGHVYVYLIYGMYHCLNFTTEKVGKPGAVLIRAVEPLISLSSPQKIELLMKRRKTEKITALCSGPGKLCRALEIDNKFNGLRLGIKIKVFDDGYLIKEIGKSSRIGIKDALDLEWRFFIKDNPFVSKVK